MGELQPRVRAVAVLEPSVLAIGLACNDLKSD